MFYFSSIAMTARKIKPFATTIIAICFDTASMYSTHVSPLFECTNHTDPLPSTPSAPQLRSQTRHAENTQSITHKPNTARNVSSDPAIRTAVHSRCIQRDLWEPPISPHFHPNAPTLLLKGRLIQLQLRIRADA